MLNDIDLLKKNIIMQAGTVKFMFKQFIKNLQKKDVSKLEEILLIEEKVNQKEVEIEENVIAMIALKQPEGKNLRTVLMILKMNNNLERIADLITDITGYYFRGSNYSAFIDLEKIIQMCNKAYEMLSGSIESFKKEDSMIAKAVCEKDNIVDNFYNELRCEIIQYIQKNPKQTKYLIDYFNIIYKVERIADLSTNIAEETIYLSDGNDIKHGLLTQ